MLLKCRELINKKQKLNEAYNKMADKQKLKQCIEDNKKN